MRPAGRKLEMLEYSSVVDGGNPQFSAVPRHLGLPPGQPAEARAVVIQSRRGVEVITGGDHVTRVRIAVERNGDERVDRLVSFVCVLLAHTDEAPPALVDGRVGIKPFAVRGDWNRYVGRVRRRTGATRRRPADLINPLVREVRIVNNAVANNIRATAVLVDAAADVVTRRSQIDNRAIGAASDEHVAPAFLRTPLEPVDVIAVKSDEAEAKSLFGNRRSRDARRPGAVRSDDRHEPNLSLL